MAVSVSQGFGWTVLIFTVIPALVWADRVNYLLTPPSPETVAVARSLHEHPERWRADVGRVSFYNDAEKIQIRRFGSANSIQVLKNGKLVPSLEHIGGQASSPDQFNLSGALGGRASSPNQFYLSGALDDWIENGSNQSLIRFSTSK